MLPRYLYLVALDVRESVKVVLGKRRNVPRLRLDIYICKRLFILKLGFGVLYSGFEIILTPYFFTDFNGEISYFAIGLMERIAAQYCSSMDSNPSWAAQESDLSF